MLPRSVFSRSNNENPNNEDNSVDLDGYNSDSDSLESSNSILNDSDAIDNSDENKISSPGYKIADKTYIYTASTMLNNDGIHSIPTEYEDIILLLYKVNTEGKTPFLEFGLTYIPNTGECDFMRIPKSQLCQLSTSFKNNSIGYMLRNNTAIVFVELDNKQREANQMISFIIPTLQFVVADEIINLQHVFGFPISEEVTEFFSEFRHFLFLHDTNYNMFETPCIGYAGIEKSNADFIQVFGIDRSESTAPFGSGFYFTNFANAEKNSVNPVYDYLAPCLLNQTGDKKNGVVSRFVLFLGKMKVVTNHPDNEIDESDIKTCMLNKLDTRKNAKMTMRITDHDGKWQNNFDSVFIGDLLLDDGSRLDMGPLYVIKEHNQQMCIDYKSTPLLNALLSS